MKRWIAYFNLHDVREDGFRIPSDFGLSYCFELDALEENARDTAWNTLQEHELNPIKRTEWDLSLEEDTSKEC
jgi:hypothetical protein